MTNSDRVSGTLVPGYSLSGTGLTGETIQAAVAYTHQVLDALDATLVNNKEDKMAYLIELANLSAMIGNLFRQGIAQNSDGRFQANGPHKYPDLLSTSSEYSDIEIKVALETNNPKGHLAKPGPHITVRYSLAAQDGTYTFGKDNRGDTVWIWEVRVGELTNDCFNLSNTEGDSGKTAVINKSGMNALEVIYADLDRCPYPRNGPRYKDLVKRLNASGSG